MTSEYGGKVSRGPMAPPVGGGGAAGGVVGVQQGPQANLGWWGVGECC